jgi:acetyltransferase-like isoleucine patch superfamily enzyme
MDRLKDYSVIVAPRDGVNDDVVRVVEWLAADGAWVAAKQSIVVLETTKSTFELAAERSGYVFPLASAGQDVSVGAPLAVIADRAERPALEHKPAVKASGPEQQLVTKKARALIQEHGLSLCDFAGLLVVRSEDVEAHLEKGRAAPVGTARRFRGEELPPDADWDAVLKSQTLGDIRELLTALRRRMKARFNRHVSLGDLLYDRWELAKNYGFGEGTSVYDSCLILGDVQVGRQCWIGPNTILDGGHAPLVIGDHVDIGAGSHLYTHNTIERALTGHQAPLFAKATTIGNCCFIAPQAMVAPGSVVGDHSFVAAGSYVEASFAAFSYIAGNPARRVGVVEVQGARARPRRFGADEQGA